MIDMFAVESDVFRYSEDLPAAIKPVAPTPPVKPAPKPLSLPKIPKHETPEFKNWFGESKAVDNLGKPSIVYHGTGTDVKEFSPHHQGSWDSGFLGKGNYFTSDPKIAAFYASNRTPFAKHIVQWADDGSNRAEVVDRNTGKKLGVFDTFSDADNFAHEQSAIKPQMIPVHLSIQNPLNVLANKFNPKRWDLANAVKNVTGQDIVDKNAAMFRTEATPDKIRDAQENNEKITELLKKHGYDGVIYHYDDGNREFVAFHPHQIKSAIANRGTFDPNDPHIAHARCEDDIFRYEEPESPAKPAAPVAPKPKTPKPPKPAEPIPAPSFSKPNAIGFHESTIKRALETWQPKGHPQQLLKHLEKHQGASHEAQLTGLHDFLKDKPSVTREDVLKHLESHPHQVKMQEHDEASGPRKWRVSGAGNAPEDTYDTDYEAATAAADLNQQHENELRENFTISGDAPHYTIDTTQLEDLEEREKELGGEVDLDTSRALQRLQRTKFNNQVEANDAIHEYVENFLPKVHKWQAWDDPGIQEHPGNYTIQSPYSRDRHQRYFGGNTYESEEEAQAAIDDHIAEHWEPPYSYSQDEGGGVEGVPEAYRWLPGPKENYNETHVAMPGLRLPPQFDPADYTAELLTTKDNGISQFAIIDKYGVHKDSIWHRGTDLNEPVKKWAEDENKINSAIGWKDGHDQYDRIENPIVRLRHDDRETVDGKKALHIEEIQGPQDAHQERMPPWLKDRIYDIGLKRALTMAAQGGYDRLTWTTGNQQADRYNLRKAVDRIEWHPGEDSDILGGPRPGTIIGLKEGGAIVRKSINVTELPEYVGREVAAKLLAKQEPRLDDGIVNFNHSTGQYDVLAGDLSPAASFKSQVDAANYRLNNLESLRKPSKQMIHAIEGPDLELGGQGLKQLYDRDLHRKLLDVKIRDKKLKALGVKIGTSEVPNGKWLIVQDGEVVREMDFKDTAEKLARTAGGNVEPGTEIVHSIDIPPEVAAEIKKHGVNFYRREEEPERYSRDFMDVIRRMPSQEAAGVAKEMLRLMDLRPEYMRMFSTEEIGYLRGIVGQVLGK